LYYYNYIFNLIPYLGKIYSLIYDTTDEKLFRAIDIPEVIVTLNTLVDADFTEPFVLVASIIDGFSYNNKFGIDAYIDYLIAQSSTVVRTKHLNLEYVINDILIESSIEYLMTGNYLRYLERSVDYGRKATTLSHVGAQLSILIDESGFFDSKDVGATYSVPDLKLNSSITDFFEYIPPAAIFLDEGVEIDSAVQWYLDNDYQAEKTFADQIYSVVAGVGTKELIASSETEYSNLISGLVLYLPFDKETGRAVEDLSNNATVATIIGTYSYVTSIINKSLQYNGIDTEVKLSPYNTINGSYTYSFWIRGEHVLQTAGDMYLYYQSGLLEIYYKTSDMKLYVKLTGSISDVTISSFIALSSSIDNLILIEQDQLTDDINLYINNILVDTDSIAGLGDFESGSDGYIGSKGASNYFTGLIDDFRIYNDLLSTDLKTYIYTSKKGTLAYLNDQVYSGNLVSDQRYEDANWTLAHGIIPARMITGEYIEEGDGATQSFSGEVRYNDLKQHYVIFTYISGGTEYTITDDGEGLIGTLSSTGLTGTIVYATGAYTLITYRDYLVALEYLYENTARSSLSYTTDSFPVVANSVEIDFWYDGVKYTAIDDGAGNITGTHVSSGSITYATGVIAVSLDITTDAAEDIYMEYDYRITKTPDDDTFILAEYRTDDDVQITEVGIADSDGRLIAYATFPPIQFKDMFNYLGIQLYIEK